MHGFKTRSVLDCRVGLVEFPESLTQIVLVEIVSREDVTARPLVAPTFGLRARPGQTPARSVNHTAVRFTTLYEIYFRH